MVRSSKPIYIQITIYYVNCHDHKPIHNIPHSHNTHLHHKHIDYHYHSITHTAAIESPYRFTKNINPHHTITHGTTHTQHASQSQHTHILSTTNPQSQGHSQTSTTHGTTHRFTLNITHMATHMGSHKTHDLYTDSPKSRVSREFERGGSHGCCERETEREREEQSSREGERNAERERERGKARPCRAKNLH